MVSVICFSKDRPLQLHAYIESLLYFSDIREENITIIYKKTNDTDYSNVIKNFPCVHWVEEKDFNNDLCHIVSNADDYIMFGVDDVVFKDKFSLKYATDILKNNDKIFGFSLRLGTNIKFKGKNLSKISNIIEYNWKNTQSQHYNYPWELCCTLYRKSDILDIFEKHNSAFINPNQLEGDIALDVDKYITKPHLAFEKSDTLL